MMATGIFRNIFFCPNASKITFFHRLAGWSFGREGCPSSMRDLIFPARRANQYPAKPAAKIKST